MSRVPPRLAALLLAAAAAVHAQPAAPGWRLSLASDRHVDALALGRLGDDEAARALDPRAGRNLGYLFDELRLERRGDDGARVALLARQRAIAIASEGALELARQSRPAARPDATATGASTWTISASPAPAWSWARAIWCRPRA
ncbi:MAG: hypothetical protein U1F21_14470 [Sphaerotilus natans]